MFKELNRLRPFLEDPEREFNVREYARLLKISPATASQRLKQWDRQHILKSRKERFLDLYKADLDSDCYRDLKIYYNTRKIKENILQHLNRFYLKPTIVLFGSAASGLDTISSDFDLLIISEKNKVADLSQQEKNIGRKIQLHVVSDIRKLRNKHLVNNILNGITIQGAVKWT